METVEETAEIRLNVRVTGGLAQYVQEQISSGGLYEGQSELVREALRLHRANQDAQGYVNSEISAALEDVRAGEFYEFKGNLDAMKRIKLT